MIWPYKPTAAERRALLALDRMVPRHPEDLHRRDKVRGSTLWRLCEHTPSRPPLAVRLDLKPATTWKTPYWTFYCLTDAGEALRKELAA